MWRASRRRLVGPGGRTDGLDLLALLLVVLSGIYGLIRLAIIHARVEAYSGMEETHLPSSLLLLPLLSISTSTRTSCFLSIRPKSLPSYLTTFLLVLSYLSSYLHSFPSTLCIYVAFHPNLSTLRPILLILQSSPSYLPTLHPTFLTYLYLLHHLTPTTASTTSSFLFLNQSLFSSFQSTSSFLPHAP